MLPTSLLHGPSLNPLAMKTLARGDPRDIAMAFRGPFQRVFRSVQLTFDGTFRGIDRDAPRQSVGIEDEDSVFGRDLRLAIVETSEELFVQ